MFLYQAWNTAVAKPMGRRTGLRDPMPDPSRPELRLQLYHHRSKRHIVVACTLVMAESSPLWTTHHSPEGRRCLPVPATV